MRYIEIGLINPNLPLGVDNINMDSINTDAWEALGEIFDLSLKERPEILASIKNDEWIWLGGYSFIALSEEDFNAAISMIDSYIQNIKNPSNWQAWGMAAWERIVVPLLPQDCRYKGSIHRPHL